MPFGLTPAHLIIVLIVVLIVVGPGRLPETGAALGRSIKGFREALEGKDTPAGQPPQAQQTQQTQLPPSFQQPFPGQYPQQPQQPYAQAPYPQQQPYGQAPYPQQQPYGQAPYPQQQPYGQAPYPQQPYGQPPMGATPEAGSQAPVASPTDAGVAGSGAADEKVG